MHYVKTKLICLFQNFLYYLCWQENKHNNMAKASIKTVASTETACIFSLCFEGESFTEFEKFVTKHKTLYSKDLNIILAAINRMLEVSGFLERYFRPEGKMRDNVCALPITSGKLRLYCLRMSDSILIAGNGGVKDTKKYQDSEELSGYVISLQNLEDAIRVAVKKGEITIEEHTINNIDHKIFDV